MPHSIYAVVRIDLTNADGGTPSNNQIDEATIATRDALDLLLLKDEFLPKGILAKDWCFEISNYNPLSQKMF